MIQRIRNKNIQAIDKFSLQYTHMGYTIKLFRKGKDIIRWNLARIIRKGGRHMASEQEKCCCQKTKERSEKEYKDLIHRLNRIEGQVRGIKGMVERDVYCTDILVQVAAVNAALNSFNKVLLANHIKTCVTQDIREGKEETVDELVAVLQKLMK